MRYAILTDIHANYTALQAVLKDLPDDAQIWLLGDIVGYGPAVQAAKCLYWLRFQSGVDERWIPGNHDECIVDALCQPTRDAATTLAVQRSYLQQPNSRSDWEWFCERVGSIIHNTVHEESLEIEDEKGSLAWERFEENDAHPALAVAFSHASAGNNERRLSYLYPWLRVLVQDELRKLRGMDPAPIVCLLHGHTHFTSFAHLNPFGELKLKSIKYKKEASLEDGSYLICPGSVGQPRDGDPRAAYALLDPEKRTVEFRRVEYDIEAVVRDLQKERDNRETWATLERAELKLAYETGNDHTLSYSSYRELTISAYDSLINRLRTGNGGTNLDAYTTKAYQRPEWDLEAVE